MKLGRSGVSGWLALGPTWAACAGISARPAPFWRPFPRLHPQLLETLDGLPYPRNSISEAERTELFGA